MEIIDSNLTGPPQVYPLREDSFLLAGAARVAPGERVLEVGCGLGLAALSAARAGARVIASDINPYALTTLLANARSRGLDLSVVRANLLRPWRGLDVILFNPPYLPTVPGEGDPEPWIDRALNGGPDGLSVSQRFLEQLPGALAPDGRCYVLLASVRGSRPDPLGALPPAQFSVRRVAERTVGAERLSVVEISREPAGSG